MIHILILFSVLIIALIASVFLYLFVKRNGFNKWLSYLAVTLAGVVILLMAAAFIAGICRFCCPGEGWKKHKRMYRKEIAGHRMGMEGKMQMGPSGQCGPESCMPGNTSMCGGMQCGCMGMEKCCMMMGNMGKTSENGTMHHSEKDSMMENKMKRNK